MFREGEHEPDEGMFLELGINRLARDLFLLVAVYALFIVMFLGAVIRLTSDNSWLKEGHVVEDTAAVEGLLLSMHIRKDGRIEVAERIADTPEQAAAAVAAVMKETPALKEARVILNTYRETPSILTSDVVHALAGVGLNPDRFRLRFTDK